MHGFRVFLGKELKEIVHTWRLWVLPAVMVFIGVTSPIVALFTPQLIESLGSYEQTGILIQMPDPVTADAYLQFTSNATELALIGVIIAVAGMVSAEKRSGTAVLVLTKPVSRTGMVVAKVVSNWVLILGATVLGAGLCIGVTVATFDSQLIVRFAQAAAVWFTLASLFVACMALLSVLIDSQGGAAGAGIGVYLIVAILSGWGPAREYSPAGLMSAGSNLVAGENPSIMWPVVTAVVLSLLLVVAASWVFERQEL